VSYEARVFVARPYHKYLAAARLRGTESYHVSGGSRLKASKDVVALAWSTVDTSQQPSQNENEIVSQQVH